MVDSLRAVHLGPDVSVAAGEWILITFSIGSRSTAAMAVLVEDDGKRLAQFDGRDWDRIQAFALRSQSPPSSRAPRFAPSIRVRDVHMPSAFPTTAEGLGAPFLQVLHFASPKGAENDDAVSPDSGRFDATLSAHGMVVESARTLDRCEERLRASRFHVLILHMTKGMPELGLLAKLPTLGASRPLVVCLTTGAESIDLVRAFEAGADECMSGETPATELAARLTALVLRQRAQNPGAA